MNFTTQIYDSFKEAIFLASFLSDNNDIEYERGAKFECPNCGDLCKVHDGNVKRIRHLDLFDYRCYLNIKVPRTSCNKDGVKVVHSTPWDRKGNHYSLKF